MRIHLKLNLGFYPSLTGFLLSAFVLLIPSIALSEAQELKIGVIVPLTGSLAYVGEEIRDGVILGEENFSSEIFKFKTFFEDNQYDLKQTVAAAHKLINQDKVDVLITLWDGADVVAPIAERAGKLHISIRWNPDVAALHKLTFTFESTYLSFARDQLKLLEKLGVKRLAIIQHESQGQMLGAQELSKIAKNNGLEIVGFETFISGESDFRSMITKLLGKKPDIFVLYTWPPETQLIIKQLRQLNQEQAHTGYYEVVDETDLLESQIFVSQFEIGKEFQTLFEKRFGKRAKTRAAHAYEIIHFLEVSYQKNNKADMTPQDLALALMQLKEFPSVLGSLNVNETRNIEHPNVWKIFKSGKARIIPVGKNW